MLQETLKNNIGLNDDGTRSKRKSIKRNLGGSNLVLSGSDTAMNNYVGNAVVGGTAYLMNNNNDRDIAKCGKRISMKRPKAEGGFWQNYEGATYNAAGNLLGAGLTGFGNMWAANQLGKAYDRAAGILGNAYANLQTIDDSIISREDYAPTHSMAAIRVPNINANPQMERIRRDAAAERNNVNRSTMSSAARQQRLAGINDREQQRYGETLANAHNQEENIKAQNAANITQTSNANADRDAQARQSYTQAKLSLAQYNNDIVNSRTLGMANAFADAAISGAETRSSALSSTATALGSALSASANGFGTAFDTQRKMRSDLNSIYVGADTEAMINNIIANGDKDRARNLLQRFASDNSELSNKYRQALKDFLNRR